MIPTYDGPSQPVVYRVYDKSGRLIYIGATRALAARFHGHELASWWFGLVGEVTTEEHPTMASAFAAETVAIQEENPPFNVRHTGRMGPLVTPADLAVMRRWDDVNRPLGYGVRWLSPAWPERAPILAESVA